MAALEKLSRTDRAKLLGLTLEARVIQTETDLDTNDDRFAEIASAIKAQTRSIIAGLGAVILVLVGLGVFK